jgi:TetR/AcrR family transcriptional regulator, transcriptional repressor for nem operon
MRAAAYPCTLLGRILSYMPRKTKADTHAKILKVAAKRFRELGLDGIGVADVMKQAGVTVGAFYKHFKSRDELVVEALGTAFKDLDAWEKHAESLAQLLENYLTEYHRDNPGAGCAMGALLGDMSRASKSAKTVYTTRVKLSLAVTAGLLPSEENADKRGRALLILSSLLGALNLSRAVSDPSLSREILEQVRRQLVDLSSGNALSKRGAGRERQKRMQSTS